jgi:uncharacterized protein (UPF0548 family)
VSSRRRKRLAALSDKPVNFDPATVDLANPPAGWTVDDRCQPLPLEPPGEPAHDGSWEIARRLIQGYEFADPSMVRAYYDVERPLPDRNMLLELRALRFVKVLVGVRVGEVYDERRELGGRDARVFGWYYRTLEGHVEEGQMDWQVWKWLDTGEVEFRVHAVSRTAPIANPLVRLGFWLLRDHERAAFLNSTGRRMQRFTELALNSERPADQVRDAASRLTARHLPAGDTSGEQLARQLDDV